MPRLPAWGHMADGRSRRPSGAGSSVRCACPFSSSEAASVLMRRRSVIRSSRYLSSSSWISSCIRPPLGRRHHVSTGPVAGARPGRPFDDAPAADRRTTDSLPRSHPRVKPKPLLTDSTGAFLRHAMGVILDSGEAHHVLPSGLMKIRHFGFLSGSASF